MSTAIIVITSAAAAAAVSWAITFLLGRLSLSRKIAAKDKEISSKDSLIAEKEAAITLSEQLRRQEAETARALLENEQAAAKERLEEARADYSRSLKTIEENQKAAIENTRTQLALQNEQLIRQREEAIKKESEETFKAVTGSLDKTLRDMKESFDAQAKANTEGATSIKTKFDETVNNLRLQTEALGSQAADLTKALKGQNKMQGIFGETILENILKSEGLVQGRDYESEYYLRDDDGNIIRNAETGKKMRPDFALHFPDSTDILIDSKVSLSALADWFAADDDEGRKEASKRNLESVCSHIAELVSKEYQKYVKGRKTLDYVIMFIPNYGAYQLAKQEDPGIFKKAFEKNVLITTEETLIPFLRLIRSAWVNKQTMDNISSIMDAARDMVDRVALFCDSNAALGKSLEKALETYQTNTKRLVDGNQSIVKAARKVIRFGVLPSAGKSLPEVSEE